MKHIPEAERADYAADVSDAVMMYLSSYLELQEESGDVNDDVLLLQLSASKSLAEGSAEKALMGMEGGEEEGEPTPECKRIFNTWAGKCLFPAE